MRRYVIIGGVAAVLLCAVVITLSRAGNRDLMRRLDRATPPRTFAPRLSIATDYHGCTPGAPREKDELVQREACRDSGESPLSPRDLAAAAESAHPDSLQASALATVIWWDDAEASLDSAILRLEKARRLSPGSVPLLVDLSAAYLVRAERAQHPRDLFAGLEAAREALAREPRNEAALFNAALALQANVLDEEAGRAWDAYLAVDASSGWAVEARQRKRRLMTAARGITLPSPGTSTAEVQAFAKRYPQEARELAWDRVLGEWGAAVQAGDTARAASLLSLAEGLGRALEQRSGGDASLMDAVRAIRAVRSRHAATMSLARAHQAFAAARGHLEALEYATALDSLNRVMSSRLSPVLVQWARLFQVPGLSVRNKPREAMAALYALVSEVDTVRYPTLAGRARLLLGTMLLRNADFPNARSHLEHAASHFRRAGETELLAAVVSTDGETVYEQGDTILAYNLLHQARLVLRRYRDSHQTHKHLMALGMRATLDGMPRAALSVYDESVRVATRTGIALDILEALQYRSRARAIVGDSVGAARDLDAAVVWFDRLPREHAQIAWARAVLWMASPEAISEAAMDSAVNAVSSNILWRVPALFWRAEARLARGDRAAAIHDLDSVTSHIRGLSGKETDVRLRAAIIERARSRFDQLVMLYLAADSVEDALRVLERGRVSLAPAQDSVHPPRLGRLSAPPGESVVEYALIGDTLLSWLLRADSVQLLHRVVDRNTFLLAVEQVNAGLESPAREAVARPGLRWLYDLLIRPLRERLGPAETPLVILVDDEVAGVPFAALWDEQRDRYLIHDHPLRFAATLADVASPPVPERAPPGPVLLVANPTFDPGDHPTLDPLPGSRAEVDSLARLYRDNVRLWDRHATRKAFWESAEAASVIHYAGHAVFDDARPERSYLVLAGADSAGRLTAQEVNAMELQSAPLVVLSACRTLRSRAGRMGGFAGLSGALLAAGANGVVGSLWQASDSLTQPLMVAFHREYQRLHDPARALRAAQLHMIRQHDRALSSPAAWAGFRYMGN